MVVLLHVAEKPSVARSVATALLPPGGHLPPSSAIGGATPAFSFDGPAPAPYGPTATHIVTSVSGHLLSVDFKKPFACVAFGGQLGPRPSPRWDGRCCAPRPTLDARCPLRVFWPFCAAHRPLSRSWTACNPVELFTAPVSWFVPEGSQAIERQLLALARRASVREREGGKVRRCKIWGGRGEGNAGPGRDVT